MPRFGGFNSKAASCPPNYPKTAPSNICNHVAFVEMDGQMTYKQAMAYLATRNEVYAHNLLSIISTWALTNKEWGLGSENGPLEAAWGIAAMARSLEMLKGAGMTQALVVKWSHTTRMFASWYKAVVHPDMQRFIEMTQQAMDKGIRLVHGNWHSSIAEAWMAVGIMSDNSTLYEQGVELFKATSNSYFRWGRHQDFKQGRILGECTETLRDIYHTQARAVAPCSP